MAIRTITPDPNAAMGDIPPITLDEGKLSGTTATYLSSALRGIIAKFNGGISLGNGDSGYRAGNLDAQYIDVFTPSVADTEFTVPHGLGRKPIGYDVVRRDKAAIVYDSSGGSWSDTLLYLKCNVASTTIKLRVY
jgi:hypothetical protein